MPPPPFTPDSVAQSWRDTQFELTDFIRTRTEFECIIEDLRAAGQNVGGKREDFEAELREVEEKVAEREELLEEFLPEWEEQRELESMEKRRLEEASANFNSLFQKQGRVTKFRTKSERDAFLRHKIASVSAYKANQASALEATRTELDTGKQSQNEIDTLIQSVQGKIEDGRQKAKEISENLAGLKEEHTKLTERRKDLWREDSKVDNLVSRASDELRTAERALADMMDKVSFA